MPAVDKTAKGILERGEGADRARREGGRGVGRTSSSAGRPKRMPMQRERIGSITLHELVPVGSGIRLALQCNHCVCVCVVVCSLPLCSRGVTVGLSADQPCAAPHSIA